MNSTAALKPPFLYYGGKSNMLRHILPLIPPHKIYVEPFFGSGAVYFAKSPSEVEVINDKNDLLINFYRVLKTDFEALKKEVECTLHSRAQHREARDVLREPEKHSAVKKAWAIYVRANQSFGASISLGSGWGYGIKSNLFERKVIDNIDRFDEKYFNRIRSTQVESDEALKVIRVRDTAETFFYIDPPYLGTDCKGYTDYYKEEDFFSLLELLSNIKGKYLLSFTSYDLLIEYARDRKLGIKIIDNIGVKVKSKASGETKKKSEVLVWNYDEKAERGGFNFNE